MKIFTATPRADLYTRVTERVIADLEHGVRPWLQPWNAGHAAGRITLPLRHNGTPYCGINILLLWGDAMTNGYASPIWMTFKQAPRPSMARPMAWMPTELLRINGINSPPVCRVWRLSQDLRTLAQRVGRGFGEGQAASTRPRPWPARPRRGDQFSVVVAESPFACRRRADGERPGSPGRAGDGRRGGRGGGEPGGAGE